MSFILCALCLNALLLKIYNMSQMLHYENDN